ncbi:MAG: sigma-54-dependent Fis family transcriptional regulator [Acidobacteria bacterium]|jgi:transcriptional regulator with PAS, ATPase and Fis domain|nr:sigma-54-dependent Fis family transcriptional regulator [Acidobacteriota bacterium]
MCKNFNETESLELLAGFDFLDLCLLGETGTGKTRLARLVHELSPRAARPFIAVNCAELSPTIIEAELFGYEKGAFTGALSSKAGKFESAVGGTIFLDEIGELSSDMQAKLLKVVEEKYITRVGSVVPRTVDLRIIYATHRDLKVLREDLRYRIAAHTIKLKPLRKRHEEIVPLARTFIADFIQKSGRQIAASEKNLQLLKHAEWRGNVRELRSFVETACLDALFLADRQNLPDGQTIIAELTEEILLSRLPQSENLNGKIETNDSIAADYKQEIKEFDRQLVIKILEKNSRNVSRTAAELGLSRYGLIKKIKRYGIIFADQDDRFLTEH